MRKEKAAVSNKPTDLNAIVLDKRCAVTLRIRSERRITATDHN